jgi:uncharacterized membrane protein
MKNAEFLKREAINWIFILLPFIYIFIVHDKLPRFAPFTLNADQGLYQVILFVMGISVFWYLVLLFKPSLVPKTAYNDNLKNFHRIRTIMLGFTSLLSLTFISQKIGIPFNWSKIGFSLGMVYLIAIGNLYPTIRYNYFIGIKNSWTLSNELIWKKTHSFAGKVFFWGGLIGAIYGISFNVNSIKIMPLIYVGYVFVLVSAPKLYSYLLYRHIQMNISTESTEI